MTPKRISEIEAIAAKWTGVERPPHITLGRHAHLIVRELIAAVKAGEQRAVFEAGYVARCNRDDDADESIDADYAAWKAGQE